MIILAVDNKAIRSCKINHELYLALPKLGKDFAVSVPAETLRKDLHNSFYCGLSNFSVRKDICNAVFDIISEVADDGGILLNKLAARAIARLSAKTYEIPPLCETYNYLYGLFRAHCFSFEWSDFDYYNPVITGCSIFLNKWDNRFTTVQKIQFEQK